MSVADTVEKLQPLPSARPLHEEALSAYEASFNARSHIWSDLMNENIERLSRGSFSLHWMEREDGRWGQRTAKPSSRGMTYTDINRLRDAGTIPEITTWRSFAPRGSVREPYRDQLPDIESYVVTDRRELWSDNVVTLYEEAKARQWNATRDIAWDELETLPEDLGKATCQLCTFLTEIEFVAGDWSGSWPFW